MNAHRFRALTNVPTGWYDDGHPAAISRVGEVSIVTKRNQDQCQFADFIDDPDASCPESGSHYLVDRSTMDPNDNVVKALERDFPDDAALDFQFAGWMCDEHAALLLGSFPMVKEIPIEEVRGAQA